MENTKYGKRWTPIRAKAQDTIANPNSRETHLVRKRLDIGLLRALSPELMMISVRKRGVQVYSLQLPVSSAFGVRRAGLIACEVPIFISLWQRAASSTYCYGNK